MKTARDAVDALMRLHRLDRDWILERLSADQKGRLALQLDAYDATVDKPAVVEPPIESRVVESTTDNRTPAPAADGIAVLAQAEVLSILERLQNEPAWVIHALLSAHRWPWQEAVLAGLPGTVRLEVMRLNESGVKFAPAVERALVSAMTETAVPVCRNSVPVSKFERLLAQMRGSRGKKTWFGMRGL